MEFDAKKALKEAKEFVKKKEYDTALDICKDILKHDKCNYLSWVLSAVCYQESGQYEKAMTAFLRATELQPTQLTAWQGFAAFLEQERSRTVLSTDAGLKIGELKEKLIFTYDKLAELLISDPVKHQVILKKQCELFGSIGMVEECIAVSKLLLLKNNTELTKCVVKSLSPWFSQINQDDLEMLEGFIRKHLTDEQPEEGSTFYKEQHLIILLKCSRYDQAIEIAKQILECDAANQKSLESICICYVEGNANISAEAAGGAISSLLAINSENPHAILANAQLHLNKGSALEAKHLLQGFLSKEKNSRGCGEKLLCDAYQQLQQWKQMETMCRLILASNVIEPLQTHEWKIRLIESLLQQESDEPLNESSKLLTDVDSSDLRVKLLNVAYQIRCNDFESPSWILDSDEDIQLPSDLALKLILLKAQLLDKTGRGEEAIELLEESKRTQPHSVSLLLHSAKQCWKLNQRAKSISDFLSAIKINKDIAEPYVYLGTFYAGQSDNASSLRRAVQCLEKAFQLDPTNASISKQLLELYRRSQDITAALKLLDSVIGFDPRNGLWAWSLKGHFHMKMLQKSSTTQEKTREATLAISCFQKALRGSIDDSACWEALGDAYMARGSYMSALKTFQKAVELNPGSIYPVYQIAAIKQLLGEYRQAVEAYDNLLIHTPDYLPALKGLAETLLSQAADYAAEGFTGRLVDCCSSAFHLLVKAAKLHPQFSCVWSLMGQICLMLQPIPETDVSKLQVPSILLDSEEDTTEPMSKRDIIELGPKFFTAALKCLPKSACLWHNLALSYQSCNKNSPAMMAIKQAITLEPTESSHWNLLGLLADKPEICQHAFIRAIELNPTSPKTAAIWTNLGALYFQHGDLLLAHECYKNSQNIDPLYVAAWIGQAYIAEESSPSEAMDLFRHTTPAAIGSGRRGECEGSPSYAQWVMTTLSDPQAKNTAHYRYSIAQMHAVPTAIDGLVRYNALYPNDSCALNLLGLLYERQGLLSQAEKVFLQGIECMAEEEEEKEEESALNQARLDKMKANLARIYTAMDRYDDATNLYASLQESELSSVFGIALAHFKAGRHEESFFTYSAAQDWLTGDDEKLSHLKVAMAMATFRRDFPDAEEAKSLLFQSCQLQPPSVYGLLALAGLGLLTEDETLTDAAFQEMLPYQTEPCYITDITFLTAFYHRSAHNNVQARYEIMRNIHMLPNVAELWILLSLFQATLAVEEYPKIRPADGLLVARTAEIAYESRRLNGTNQDHLFRTFDQSEVLALISLGYLLAGQLRKSLVAAQKAVHCNPQSAASWSILLAAAVPSWTSSDGALWLKQLIQHLRRQCDVATYTGLATWLGNYDRRLTSLLNQT